MPHVDHVMAFAMGYGLLMFVAFTLFINYITSDAIRAVRQGRRSDPMRLLPLFVAVLMFSAVAFGMALPLVH